MPRISDDEVQGVIDRYGYDCDCYDVIALGKVKQMNAREDVDCKDWQYVSDLDEGQCALCGCPCTEISAVRQKVI